MCCSGRVPKEHCGRPYSVATTSACGSEVQKPVDVPQVKYTQDFDDYFHRREHSIQLSSSRLPLHAYLSYLVLGRTEQRVCFEVPMKRDLMALVRAQEEALDFERLQLRWQLRLTAGLRRTRTAVSSVFLATAAQGLQLDIARRLRAASATKVGSQMNLVTRASR